nr:extracellular solute-binding protein [Demequina litorisediminis]
MSLEIQEVTWEDLQPRLTTLAQSQEFEELPDIFLMQNNAFQKNAINYPDLFTDITDSGIAFDEFPEGVTAYSTLDGANYGVPFDAGTAVSALRTDILEEAGLTVDDFTDITWDQYIEPRQAGPGGHGQAHAVRHRGRARHHPDDAAVRRPEPVRRRGQPHHHRQRGACRRYRHLLPDGRGRYLPRGQLVGRVHRLAGQRQRGGHHQRYLDLGLAADRRGPVGQVEHDQPAHRRRHRWSHALLCQRRLVVGRELQRQRGASRRTSSPRPSPVRPSLYDTILPASGAVANWLPAGDSDVYAEPQEFFGGQPIYADVISFGAEVPANNTGAYYYEARDAVGVAITQIMGGTDAASALGEAQSTVEFAMN